MKTGRWNDGYFYRFALASEDKCQMSVDGMEISFYFKGGELVEIKLGKLEEFISAEEKTLGSLWITIGGDFFNLDLLCDKASEFMLAYEVEENDGDSYEKHMQWECRQENFV